MARTPEQTVRDTQLMLEGHKPCPTCPSSRPMRCCNCGAVLRPDEERLAPDPYAFEVEDDARPHLQCPTCLRESALNIRGHEE